jgi:hypothetical protein
MSKLRLRVSTSLDLHGLTLAQTAATPEVVHLAFTGPAR